MLTTIFRFLCIIGAGFMVGYWIYKYHINQDATLLEYVPIDKVENLILPIPTICFARPFIKNDLLEETNSTTFKKDYLEYLSGNDHYDQYRNIDYNQVTPNLTDYFNFIAIHGKGEKNITQKDMEEYICSNLNDCPFVKIRNNYNGFSARHFNEFLKCYSIEIDLKDIHDAKRYTLSFKSNFKTILDQVGARFLDLIHPSQLLRPRVDPVLIWSDISHGDLFKISSIEILTRRNKYNHECSTNWQEYDDWILKKFLSNVGCRPPYIQDNDEIPVCKTKDEIKGAKFDGWKFVKRLLDPCKEIPFVSYMHEFFIPRDSGMMAKDYLLSISYPPMVKLITHSQAVDAHSLIGNIGGYIGLFLGCAIIQLPELVLFLREYIRNALSQIYSFLQKNYRKEFNSNNTKISGDANDRYFRSAANVASTTTEYISEANLGLEDKLRLILERMDKQELKWDLKFDSLKNSH